MKLASYQLLHPAPGDCRSGIQQSSRDFGVNLLRHAVFPKAGAAGMHQIEKPREVRAMVIVNFKSIGRFFLNGAMVAQKLHNRVG